MCGKRTYCREPLVAEFELRLEREKQYERFLDVARDALKQPWEERLQASFADDDFSLVMHRMRPELFTEPTTWIDTKGGSADRAMSPDEATRMLADMLHYRAPGKTLFVVVDEVSQYIHQDSQRMLKLQSFVSSLGQRLRGRVWLLVTGQERLDEESDKTVIGKMKDRFPSQLRVHLATTNIRDVVHRRLLEKDPLKEQVLRDLYREHRASLRLYAYEGDSITEDDFVEVYPMLPGHVDLLMRITSALRLRSTRSQGDEHAIRGLLQLLGELFRSQKLAEREVGALVTLDAIYEVQQTALDSDIQTTLHRLLEHCAEQNDELATRAAKAVALLELIQEHEPTSAELVAACLYDRMDRGNQIDAVRDALERLRQENLLGYSEKHGYKVQSSAGQEWDRERRDIGVTPEQQSERIQHKLKYLLGSPDRPKLQGVPFPWSAWYSDNRQASDKPLVRQTSGANAPVDFRFLPASETQSARWVQRSDEETLKDRLIWVVGEAAQALADARELDKSQRMVDRYKHRRESLTREKQRLLLEEEARAEDLELKLEEVVARAWMQGTLYFRGREMSPGDLGGSFASALETAATRVLPDLYPHFISTAVTETELLQLLDKSLNGLSQKFLEGDLGIVSLDAGQFMPTCSGRVPAAILGYVEQQGSAGATLFEHFGRPPYGFSSAVIRACLAGLLRAGKIRVRPTEGPELTSVKDTGSKDLFRQERPLRNADILPAGTPVIGAKDRIAICRVFEQTLSITNLERDNDTIADAIYQHFPGKAQQLREVDRRLNRLPVAKDTPPALDQLGRSLEACRRSRLVEETVKAAKKHLDHLREGLPLLAIYIADLTDEAIDRVCVLHDLQKYQLTQLEEVKALTSELEEVAGRIRDQLAMERPWRDIVALNPDIKVVVQSYAGQRQQLLADQEVQSQQARDRIKRRKGFESLKPDESHKVLRPIALAMIETTPEAIAPTLRTMQDRFAMNLRRAEDEANEILDELLTSGPEETVIVKVPLRLRNRLISDDDDLQTVLEEVKERVEAVLKQNKRARLV